MAERIKTDATKAGGVAQRIVDVLANQDSETRHRAIRAAMMLLGEDSVSDPAGNLHSDSADNASSNDLGQFFNRGEKFKPSDHAQLCAAYHYLQFGPAVFSLDEIRAIAAEAGVVLPDRLDMTLNSAAHSGKKLFQPSGKGAFKPTAAAGIAFNEKWGVKPGKAKKV